MESALYGDSVWLVYGRILWWELGDGVGLGPGTWSGEMEMSWTQNVACPYAWGGKVILLECILMHEIWMQVVESDEATTLLAGGVHII
jgi:hypothetical protein